MAKIPLGNGYFTEVDDEDIVWLYSLCKNWYLHISKGGYLYARGSIEGKNIYMHNILKNKLKIKGKPDHKDRNTLNNRKENIRESTNSQNNTNTKTYKNNLLGIKGIYLNNKTNKYEVRIYKDYNCIFLGHFDELEQAKEARIKGIIKYHGEFGNLNLEDTGSIINREEQNNIQSVNFGIILSEEEEKVELELGKSNTGYKGISFKKGKFEVSFRNNKDMYYIGRYDTLNEAIKSCKRFKYNKNK